MIDILYPYNLNWFYMHLAEALEQELEEIGVSARIQSSLALADTEMQTETVLILSMWESIHSAGMQNYHHKLLKRLKLYKNRVLLNYDSLFTQYFRRHFVHDEALVTHIIDIGFSRQQTRDDLYMRPYCWIPECLTSDELYQSTLPRGPRPIPWVSLGHVNRSRVSLISAAMKILGPSGLVFLPPVRPFDASNGFDYNGVNKILRNAEIYIWGSHHSAPYHEGLRVPHALAAGALPVKIDPLHHECFENLPWVYSSLTAFKDELRRLGTSELYSNALEHVTKNGRLGLNILACLKKFNCAA